MSRLATSFVLGYHGCDRSIGQRAVNGDIDLLHSDRDFDWLGPGAYFWESDPQRALEWARWKAGRGDYANAFVVGAVIDLRNCLTLFRARISSWCAPPTGASRRSGRRQALRCPRIGARRASPTSIG